MEEPQPVVGNTLRERLQATPVSGVVLLACLGAVVVDALVGLATVPSGALASEEAWAWQLGASAAFALVVLATSPALDPDRGYPFWYCAALVVTLDLLLGAPATLLGHVALFCAGLLLKTLLVGTLVVLRLFNTGEPPTFTHVVGLAVGLHLADALLQAATSGSWAELALVLVPLGGVGVAVALHREGWARWAGLLLVGGTLVGSLALDLGIDGFNLAATLFYAEGVLSLLAGPWRRASRPRAGASVSHIRPRS